MVLGAPARRGCCARGRRQGCSGGESAPRKPCPSRWVVALHRRRPPSRSPGWRGRSPPRSPPLGAFQSRSGIASPSADLVLRGPSPPPRRPEPGRGRGAGGAGCAGRSGGDRREGTGGGGDPARGPASLVARANCLRSEPRAPGRAGPLEPRGGRVQSGEGGSGSGDSASHLPAGGRWPPDSRFPPRFSRQPFALQMEPAGRGTASPPAPRLPTLTPAGPAPWSRPAFARIRDSPARAPTRPTREPKGAWPPRCEPGPLRAEEPGPPRPPRPTRESSARDQLRSFSGKEALRVRRLQLRKCSAFFPGAAPSSAPSPGRFLLHFFAFCFFLKKSNYTQRAARVQQAKVLKAPRSDHVVGSAGAGRGWDGAAEDRGAGSAEGPPQGGAVSSAEIMTPPRPQDPPGSAPRTPHLANVASESQVSPFRSTECPPPLGQYYSALKNIATSWLFLFFFLRRVERMPKMSRFPSKAAIFPPLDDFPRFDGIR